MWIVLAFLAAFLYAMTNIIDKMLVVRYGSGDHPGRMELVVVTGLSSLIPVAILPFIVGFRIIAPDIWWLLGAGVCFGVAMVPYTLALHRFDVVRCSMVYLVSIPIISYFIGLFVFSEVFSVTKLVFGFFAVLGLLMFLSVGHQIKRRHHFRTLFFLCLSAGLMWSFTTAGFRLGAQSYDYLEAIFWMYVGLLFTTLIYLMFPGFRNDAMRVFRQTQLLWTQVVNEILGIFATLCSAAAILRGPLASVTLVENTAQPLFVFVLSISAAVILPRFHSEELEQRVLVKKIVTLIIVVGFLIGFLSH